MRPLLPDKARGQPREVIEIADLLLAAQLPRQRRRAHLARGNHGVGQQIAPQAPCNAVHQRRGVADAEQPQRIKQATCQHIGQDRRQGQSGAPQYKAEAQANSGSQRMAPAPASAIGSAMSAMTAR